MRTGYSCSYLRAWLTIQICKPTTMSTRTTRAVQCRQPPASKMYFAVVALLITLVLVVLTGGLLVNSTLYEVRSTALTLQGYFT